MSIRRVALLCVAVSAVVGSADPATAKRDAFVLGRVAVNQSVRGAPPTVMRVDRETGDRQLLSGSTPFSFVTAVASGEVWVATAIEHRILGFDPATGNARVVSGESAGAGPALGEITGLTRAPDGGAFVLANADLRPPYACVTTRGWQVLHVAAADGERTVVSGPGVGQGPPVPCTAHIAATADGAIFVADEDRVLAIDPESGDRTVLSGPIDGGSQAGAGDAFKTIEGIAAAGDALYVYDFWFFVNFKPYEEEDFNRVIRIDRTTGDRIVVSDRTIGSGPLDERRRFAGLVADGAGRLFLEAREPIEVDPVDGDRTPLVLGIEAGQFVGHVAVTDDDVFALGTTGTDSVLLRAPRDGSPATALADARVGEGPWLVSPRAIVAGARGELFVADAEAGLLRIDPGTGARSVASGEGIGTGPPLARPVGLVTANDGSLLVVDGDASSVLRVDPSSGDRTLVSGPTRGVGPALASVATIELDPLGWLIASSASPLGWAGPMVRIDRATGDRFSLTPPSVGVLDLAFVQPGLAVFASGATYRRLLVSTGDSLIVSSASIGAGPLPTKPRGVVQEQGDVLLGTDEDRLVRLDVATGDRSLVSGYDAASDSLRGDGPLLVAPADVVLAPEPAGVGAAAIAACLALASARCGGRRIR